MNINKWKFTTLSKWAIIPCFVVLFLQQCKKVELDMSVASITLSVTKTSIPADGESEVSFSATAYNSAGTLLSDVRITLYVNGQALSSDKFSTTEPGEYSFQAKAGSGITSNTVTVKVVAAQVEEPPLEEPPPVISKIALSSNTRLIIADGQSTAAIRLQFFDENDNEVTTTDYQLYANGTAINSTDFRTDDAGEYVITATGGEVTSDEIVIKARPNVQYDIITIPIIFHIGHFGQPVGTGPNLSQSQIEQAVEDANKAFANKLGSNNPNAVDMRVRFRLAEYDEQGNKLAEPGISRQNVSRYDDGAYEDAPNIINDGKLGGNEKIFWERDNYWDPEAYLNVWVFEHETSNSYANSPFVYEDFPLVGLETGALDCQLCKMPPSITMHYPDISRPTVLAHEIAHILGVDHTFSIDHCATGDHCLDTYTWNYYNAELACDDSNYGLLEHDNIMDYKGNFTTFTYDQRERVQHVLKHGFHISALKNSTK